MINSHLTESWRIFSSALLVALPLAMLACASHPKPPKGFVDVEFQTSAGTMVFRLDQARAPLTTANFLTFAGAGAYDGTIFHRVMPQFVVQGGGWTTDFIERAKVDAAAGKPDRPIANEWKNGLKNERGTIAMARDTLPDTATREFFINVVDNPQLDTPREKSGFAGYAVFGTLLEGEETLQTIRNSPTQPRTDLGVTDGSMNNVPDNPVVIIKVKRRS